MNEMDYILIDRKIDGQLDSEEEQRFARKLRLNTEFAEAYELRKAAISVLRSEQYQNHKHEIKAIYETVKSRQRRQRKMYFYAVAAGVALLLLSSLAYLIFFRPATSQELYVEYYNPYPAGPLLRGEDTSPYEQAKQWYRQENYSQALPYWQEALAQDSLSPVESERIRLFLANCYLQTNQSTEAIRVLQPMRSASDTVLQQYGTWYLALAYLKAGQPETAQEILQTITRQPGFYQTAAYELLDKLSHNS